MRQLKFRIWDKQDKRFVNNDCGTHCCSNWHLDAFSGDPVDFVNTLGDEPYQFSAQEPCDYWMDGTKIVKEPRYVVQQWTGLKDLNGKEIYEGDFLSPVAYHKHLEVKWISELDEYDWTGWNIGYTEEMGKKTVIGNKFENPELLKTNE